MNHQNVSAYEISRLLVAIVMATFITCLFFGMALDLWWYESDSPEHILSASKLEGYGLEALLFYFISRFAEYPFLQLLFASYETILVMLTWMICQRFINKYFDINKWLNLTISTGLIFLTSIYIPRYSPWFYRFSLGTQPWHNSTQLGMRLGAVYFLYYFLEIYTDNQKKITIQSWLKMAITLVISTMFKPNFLMAFCVALCIALILELIKSRDKDTFRRSAVLGSILLPALAVLGVQYLLIYIRANTGSSSGIQIVFFSDLLWEGSAQHMIVKIGRDLAFPVVVWGMAELFSRRKNDQLGIYFGENKKNLSFMMLLYFAAIIIFSVFKESGPRAVHGNFGWSISVTYFTLFLYLVPFFIQSMQIYRRNYRLSRHQLIVMDVFFAGGSLVLFMYFFSAMCYFFSTAAGHSFYR